MATIKNRRTPNERFENLKDMVNHMIDETNKGRFFSMSDVISKFGESPSITKEFNSEGVIENFGRGKYKVKNANLPNIYQNAPIIARRVLEKARETAREYNKNKNQETKSANPATVTSTNVKTISDYTVEEIVNELKSRGYVPYVTVK